MDKFVSFDLESAKAVPMYKWREYRPIGISCAATLTGDVPPEPVRTWYGSLELDATGMYDPELYPEQAGELLDYLLSMIKQGYYIITWNGLAFDFCLLADAVVDGRQQAVADLAMGPYHIDIQFAMTSEKGYAVGLKTACEGMQVEGKMDEVHGSVVPMMWQRDRDSQEKVLEYVAQDARATVNIYKAIMQNGFLQWISRSGRVQYWEIGPPGILSVAKALKLPEPDTSWMRDPRDRHEVYTWTKDLLADAELPF